MKKKSEIGQEWKVKNKITTPENYHNLAEQIPLAAWKWGVLYPPAPSAVSPGLLLSTESPICSWVILWEFLGFELWTQDHLFYFMLSLHSSPKWQCSCWNKIPKTRWASSVLGNSLQERCSLTSDTMYPFLYWPYTPRTPGLHKVYQDIFALRESSLLSFFSLENNVRFWCSSRKLIFYLLHTY